METGTPQNEIRYTFLGKTFKAKTWQGNTSRQQALGKRAESSKVVLEVPLLGNEAAVLKSKKENPHF